MDLAALTIHATDQHGTVIPWRPSLAKPTVIAFFYSRCKNATKCAAAVQNLARLRALLHERGLAASTNVWGISYEPEYDSPARLAAFGAGHGLRWPDDGVKLLATTSSDLHALIDALDVPVNFNSSWVTLHGNALYLLDGAGRLVRCYRTLMWEPEHVAADLARLTTED